jgi:hypothetical protein
MTSIPKIVDYWVNNSGYLVVKLESGGLMLEHRYVVQYLMGINLSPNVIVHHIDHNPLNNTPSNLYPTTKIGHQIEHPKKGL